MRRNKNIYSFQLAFLAAIFLLHGCIMEEKKIDVNILSITKVTKYPYHSIATYFAEVSVCSNVDLNYASSDIDNLTELYFLKNGDTIPFQLERLYSNTFDAFNDAPEDAVFVADYHYLFKKNTPYCFLLMSKCIDTIDFTKEPYPYEDFSLYFDEDNFSFNSDDIQIKRFQTMEDYKKNYPMYENCRCK